MFTGWPLLTHFWTFGAPPGLPKVQTCISCRLGHQVAQIALVHNLVIMMHCHIALNCPWLLKIETAKSIESFNLFNLKPISPFLKHKISAWLINAKQENPFQNSSSQLSTVSYKFTDDDSLGCMGRARAGGWWTQPGVGSARASSAPVKRSLLCLQPHMRWESAHFWQSSFRCVSIPSTYPRWSVGQ